MQDRVIRDDWYVVARSADLTEGQVVPARLLDEDLVLWRPGGRACAWMDLCVHRGTRLSLGRVSNGTLVCPYHGWRFGADGRCVLIPAHPDQPPPARARAVTYRVEERYGFVWVSLGDPGHPIPPFPEWDDTAYRKVWAGPYRFRAHGFRVVENFLDATHFPFVHTDLLGDPDAENRIDDYEVRSEDGGLATGDIRVWQTSADVSGAPAVSAYRYRCFRPLTAYFEKATGPGKRFTTFLNVQPVSATESWLWICVAMNFGADIPDEAVRQRQDTVYGQDRRIVETQRPERLPLDLAAEMHVRSDRLAVEYRRWLKTLGVTDPHEPAGSAT